jgi:uncharacterized FlaG/YvyC family protein
MAGRTAVAGEISQISGVAAEALPSPVVATSKRSGVQCPKLGDVRDRPVAAEETDMGGLQNRSSSDDTFLASMLEHAQSVALGDNTTISFERDDQDGKMYVYVKDKRTGEELFRIPKNYLTSIDPHHRQNHRVDVHI